MTPIRPLIALFVATLLALAPHIAAATPGDPLPRVQCVGYDAFVYAEGLFSPDGIARAGDGTLYVAEESAGRVSRVDPGGVVTSIASGLNSPEGLTIDPTGTLYVVEDVQAGRLLRIDPGGTPQPVAGGLDGPEGVTLLNGKSYVTESNVQFAPSPFEFRTHVSHVASDGTVTRVLTATLFFSFSGIASGADGQLYVINEAAGSSPGAALFRVDPSTGDATPLNNSLVRPEGLHFAPGGNFPLYVAEEDIGNGRGRLSRVDAAGNASTLCTGFEQLEDVVVAPDGTIFVVEDSSGLIVELRALALNYSLRLPLIAVY